MSIKQGGKVIAGNVSHYNIGDTFMTKRTDTSLAGAVECDGATYNTTDFTGDGSIGELLEAGKLDYVSLSAYSTAISTKGWCDKIGWDGTGTTSFRVPTITPGHYIIKSQEPTAENNYTWYKLYADGWVEQGGVKNIPSRTNSGESSAFVIFPIPMGDTNYTGQISYQSGGAYFANSMLTFSNRQTTGADLTFYFLGTGTTAAFLVGWQVSGKSSITPQTNTRVMIQIANGATDEALETCTGVMADVADLKDHRVIAFQAPTAQNNYTWYRKYADGWVEQGGLITNATTYTLPITMLDTNYYVNVCWDGGKSSNFYSSDFQVRNLTTTTFWTSASRNGINVQGRCWEVKGMSAQ